MTPQETVPDFPMSVQESGEGVGRWWPAAGSGALRVIDCAPNLLKEVAIIFMTSAIVWSQVKQQQGNNPTHQQKIGLNIY